MAVIVLPLLVVMYKSREIEVKSGKVKLRETESLQTMLKESRDAQFP